MKDKRLTKEFLVTAKVKLNGQIFLFNLPEKRKSYKNALTAAMDYIERTCPRDLTEATQIAIRIKRRLK